MCTESFENLSTAHLTRSERAVPMRGNEERAINWALPGGSAQQRGEEKTKEDSTILRTALNYFCFAGLGDLRRLDIYREIGSLQ